MVKCKTPNLFVGEDHRNIMRQRNASVIVVSLNKMGTKTKIKVNLIGKKLHFNTVNNSDIQRTRKTEVKLGCMPPMLCFP